MRLSTALVLGATIAPTAFARQNGRHRNKDHVENFIKTEIPYAWERLFCNFGPDGCAAPGVNPGVVIASPSTDDPNYFYTWTRDSGLVLKGVVDSFAESYDSTKQKHIENFIISQAKIQGIENLSGGLANGTGLGDPKYYANETVYTESWGRPQHDGPPLRAIAIIAYANWLIDNGYKSTVEEVVWPVLSNDLEYVAEFWNSTGFDVWEEVNGTSFLTTASQYRALVEGASLSKHLGKLSQWHKYASVAPNVLCLLQEFWQEDEGFILSNFNNAEAAAKRNGRDTATVLGSIHTFDPLLGCDATTFQPCSDRALSNLRSTLIPFRKYPINKHIPVGKAIAAGRYIEDVYYGGNPWYLNTLAVSEQLYDAIYVWKKQAHIVVTDVSLAFWRDLVLDIKPGFYPFGTKTYGKLLDAAAKYADGFVDIVSTYVGDGGSMSEQYTNSTGCPISARHLTWSYSAFLSATDRRAGRVGRSWAGIAPIFKPSQCGTKTIKGTYKTATPTAFPAKQTPKFGHH